MSLLKLIRRWLRRPVPTPPELRIVPRPATGAAARPQQGRPVSGNALRPFRSRPVRGNAA